MTSPAVISRKHTRVSPWVTLVERELVDGDGRALGAFHSLAQADYVNVLALTAAGEVLLVEQFRPAVEAMTLELPGGLLDPGETPERCALRELEEETGHRAATALPLGRLAPDPGRLDNAAWAFFAQPVEPIPGWQAEAGVTPRCLTVRELLELAASGRFDHAGHVAILGLALMRGLI